MDTAEHAALRVVLNHGTDTKIKQLQEELARERAARGRTLACVLAQFYELFEKYDCHNGLHLRNIGGDMLALANKLRGEGQYREAHLVEEHAHELCEKVGVYALTEWDRFYGRSRPDPEPSEPIQLVDESDYESEPESEHGEGAEPGHGPGTAEEREGEPRGA